MTTSEGCFICRPEDPAFAEVEGCSSCEASFGEYLRELEDPTGIVRRLRLAGLRLAIEAADEIERLRDEIGRLR